LHIKAGLVQVVVIRGNGGKSLDQIWHQVHLIQLYISIWFH